MILQRCIWWIVILGTGYALVWAFGWLWIFAAFAAGILTLFLWCVGEYWRAKRRIERMRADADKKREEDNARRQKFGVLLLLVCFSLGGCAIQRSEVGDRRSGRMGQTIQPTPTPAGTPRPGIAPPPNDVTLQWDPNSEPDIAGYRLNYGPQSRNGLHRGEFTYPNGQDVGNPPVHDDGKVYATLHGFKHGRTYWFSATAYNAASLESDYSNEIAEIDGVQLP
jgi:hypothetical protein